MPFCYTFCAVNQSRKAKVLLLQSGADTRGYVLVGGLGLGLGVARGVHCRSARVCACVHAFTHVHAFVLGRKRGQRASVHEEITCLYQCCR